MNYGCIDTHVSLRRRRKLKLTWPSDTPRRTPYNRCFSTARVLCLAKKLGRRMAQFNGPILPHCTPSFAMVTAKERPPKKPEGRKQTQRTTTKTYRCCTWKGASLEDVEPPKKFTTRKIIKIALKAESQLRAMNALAKKLKSVFIFVERK